MSEIVDQNTKNDRQRKRANIAVMLRDMICDRQNDFGDFFRPEVDEYLETSSASDGSNK
uniref:Uncharacterized protein n=1 Tax=Romanomermis culicivorax TaxID=13658 RepID=A0A915J4B3_ROMCU